VSRVTPSAVEQYAVGFARPDRWVQQGHRADESRPWHAVEAHRPATELDGEVELAVCGTIVQVWGGQHWERVGVGRTACQECQRLSAAVPADPAVPADSQGPAAPRGRRLRIVS
jgi:hypothetical protein